MPAGICIGLIAISFLFGGGARSDITSLLLLRPLAVIALGYGLWTMRDADLRPYRGLLVGAALITLISVLQLVPLPSALWSSLAGREIITSVDKLTQNEGSWRPLAMVVQGGWNHLFSLVVPLAALVLAVQLDGRGRSVLLPVLLIIGFSSGVLGMLQTVSGSQSPLYFYRITNGGSAVGLFANRNHQALFLAMLLPMLATFASLNVRRTEAARFRRWVMVIGGLALVPLLLVTGSRGGVILGVIGLAAMPLLYRAPQGLLPARRHGGLQIARNPWLLGGVAAMALAAVTFFAARASSLERMFGNQDGDDTRSQLWPEVAKMVGDYFPWGSGLGSFPEIYKIHEPDWALSSFYFNHAHNDYLELALTAGLPGILLLLAALVLFGRYGLAAFSAKRGGSSESDAALARLGTVLLAMFAVGSAFDYPLRVPSLAVLFVISAVWMAAYFGRGILGSQNSGHD